MRLIMLIFLAVFSFGVNAVVSRVDNFQLLDQHGNAHELYYHQDKTAIVIMVQGNGCPIVRNLITDYKKLRDQFADKNIAFFMLNTNLQDDRESILKEANEFSIDMPILHDETQLIGESLQLDRTAEVLVINPKHWNLLYRGPINDRLHYERQQTEAKHHYAAEALNAALNNLPVKVPKRMAKGCLINFPNKKPDQHAEISYTKEVAPLLEEKCAHCHREGGIGPWAMSSYEMVLGFSPMIREVIRTKRMPPWHADPHVNHFKNDSGLSVAEQQKIIHWIEAGSPRGEGSDPLKQNKKDSGDWPLGEPDLVVTLPPFKVPATGVLDYQYPSVPNPLDRDVWVKAVTLVPGDKSVVHHLLVGTTDTKPADGDNSEVFKNYLFGYAPGGESTVYPKNSGVFVPKGGYFTFQAHYTTSGRETVDQSKVALYFYKKKPQHIIRNHVIIDYTLNIPPHAANHLEQAYFKFDRDAIVYNLFPHAHYRGRSSYFDLVTPDGKKQRLLSVPNYDFNWQRDYELVEPVVVKAGSMIIHGTYYDNSANNPGNPDPTQVVGWGLQSFHEMLYGSIRFRWIEESKDNIIHDPVKVEVQQLFGFLDRNMDGVLQESELLESIVGDMAKHFSVLDLDSSGGLDMSEYMQSMRQQLTVNR